MIGFLRGTVIEKREGQIVVETASGVGYRVTLSPESDAWSKAEIGSESSLFISHQIRENEQDLYGFQTPEERNFFEQLKTVSGVGPKLAATLLAHLDRRELAQLIMNEDIAGIVAVPGIGKKMAERLIVELRDKVLQEDVAPGEEKKPVKKGMPEELVFADQALERLGFSPKEREDMLAGAEDLFTEDTPVEDVLKRLLSQSKE